MTDSSTPCSRKPPERRRFLGGLLALAAGVSGLSATPASAAEAEIRNEFARAARENLTPLEIEDGKRQLKGQVMLSLESPVSRMHRMASTVLNQDRYRKLDEILAAIDAVTEDEVGALAAEFFAPERHSTVVLGGQGAGSRE